VLPKGLKSELNYILICTITLCFVLRCFYVRFSS